MLLTHLVARASVGPRSHHHLGPLCSQFAHGRCAYSWTSQHTPVASMQVRRTMVDAPVRRRMGWWGSNPGIRTGRRPIHLRFPSCLWMLGLGAKHAQVLTRVLGVGLRSTRRSRQAVEPTAAILGRWGWHLPIGGDQGHAGTVIASTASLEGRRHHGGVGRLPIPARGVVGDAFVSLPEGA